MFQKALCLCLSVILCWETTPTVNGFPPLIAAAATAVKASGPILAKTKYFAEWALLGKEAYDLWEGDSSDRVAELDSRIAGVQQAIANVDSETYRRLEEFRRTLDERTSRDAYEEAIREAMRGLQYESEEVLRSIADNGDAVLQRIESEAAKIESRMFSLESRQADLERRQDKSERRWHEYESNFGIVPRTAPKPYELLIGHEPSTQIHSHPRVAEFMQLIVKSEQSRIKLQDYLEIYRDSSQTLEQARVYDEAICTQAAQFHVEIEREAEDYRRKEVELLKNVAESHFSVTDLRREVSSLLWLQVASKPVSHNGRLRIGVPKMLASDECCGVIGAYVASGGDARDLSPLIEMQLDELVFKNKFQISEGNIDSFPGRNDDSIRAIYVEYSQFVKDLQYHALIVRDTENLILTKSMAMSPTSGEISHLLRRQAELLDTTQQLAAKAEELSIETLGEYCRMLGEIKPSARTMTQLRERLVVPVLCSKQLLECKSWKSDTARGEVWQRLAQYAPVLATCPIGDSNTPFANSRGQFWRDLLKLELHQYYRNRSSRDAIASRDDSYKFVVAEQCKSLQFYAGNGRKRAITSPESQFDSNAGLLFESLEFESPVIFFDGGSPLAIGLTDQGEAFLLSNNNVKDWPKDRDPAAIPTNVETASIENDKAVMNPKTLTEGRIISYRGWEVKARIRFAERPRTVAVIDASRLAVLHGEPEDLRVSVFDWHGNLVGDVPVPSATRIAFLESDSRLIYAIDFNGNKVVAWELGVFTKV